MRFLHLWFLATITFAKSPIDLTTPLSLRIPAETPYSLDLDAVIQGQNLTYSLSGQYLDSQGKSIQADLPVLSQRMQLTAKVSRPSAGLVSAVTSRLVEDEWRSNIVYGIDGAQVSTWDLTIPSSPVLVTTSPEFYKGDPLTSIGYFSTEDREFLLLITVNKLSIALGVAETTTLTSTTMVPGLTSQFTLPDTFLAATFNQLSEEVMVMVTTASTVEVYGLPLTLTQKIIFHYSITNEDLQVASITPVYARSEGYQGVICDAKLGVALFSVSSFLSSPPTFHLSALDPQPLLKGSILTCDFYNFFLYVSTEGGIIEYDVGTTSLQPNMHYPRYLHSNEENGLFQAIGLSNSWFTAEYEVSQLPNSTVTTFRVYEGIYRDVESSIACDVWNERLFGSEAAYNPTPAYLLYSPPYADYVLFYSYSTFFVYTVYVDSTLAINTTLTAGYQFNGELSISNDEQGQIWEQFPVNITGLDSESSSIYPLRGALPSLYYRPNNISGFIEPGSSNTGDGYYLPLSNYFNGHNLSYTVTNLLDSDVTLTLPPKWSFSDGYTFNEISLITEVLQLPPLPRIAVIHNSEVDLFDVTGSPTLLSTLSLSEPDSVIYNIGGLLCEDQAILVIESGIVDPLSGLYNLTWDFYTVSDPVSLHLNVTFPGSIPSLELTTAGCSLFTLRGNAVDAYELNVTDWELVQGTEVTGNLPCAPLNPVSIAVTPDANTLFMYDLTLGLAFADVLDLTVSSYSCQLVPLTVQKPDPGIRLETSGSYVFLLRPEANAIPQLIQYDITDLPTVLQTQYFPSLGDCAYMDVAATDTVLTVLCTETTQSQVLIFDPYSVSYESLYTAIPVNNTESILAYSLQGGGDYVLTYDGESLYRYEILQRERNWYPDSDLEPLTSALSTYVRLNFPTQTNAHQYYQAQLQITAFSGISGLQSTTTVNITMENPGSFIYVDPGYSLSISKLAAGGNLKVENSSVTLGLPNMVFSGGNIEYELLWTGNGTEKVIPPSSSCSQQIEPCLVPKVTEQEVFETYPLTTFTQFGDQLLSFSENQFIFLQLQTGFWAVSQVFPLHLEVGNVTCSYLQHLTPSDYLLVLGLCTADTTSFLAVFNLKSLNNTDLFIVNFHVNFIYASYDYHQGSWMVYVSDELNVNVLVVSPAETVGYFTVKRVGVINAITMDLAEMYPAALTTANNSYVYLSDYAGYLYALQPQDFSRIAVYKSSDMIVGMQLGTDGLRLYAVTEGGTVLIMDSELTVVYRTIPPLSALETVSLWNQVSVDSAEEWLAFGVFNSSQYTLRVIDLTPYTVHSEIYTSIQIGPFRLVPSVLLTGSILIVNENPGFFEVAVMQHVASFPLPLRFFTVQKSPSVTFYPGPHHTDTVQLRVYNAYSSYTCAALNVTYGFVPPGEDTGNPYRDRSDFNHWYVWLVLSLGAFGILVAAGVVLGRMLRRKKHVREDPLLSLPSISREPQA